MTYDDKVQFKFLGGIWDLGCIPSSRLITKCIVDQTRFHRSPSNPSNTFEVFHTFLHEDTSPRPPPTLQQWSWRSLEDFSGSGTALDVLRAGLQQHFAGRPAARHVAQLGAGPGSLVQLVMLGGRDRQKSPCGDVFQVKFCDFLSMDSWIGCFSVFFA